MKRQRSTVMPAQAGIQFFKSSKNWIPAFAGMTMLLSLTGCESIGEGNTLQSLEILPASGSTETSPSYPIYQCLRDQLVVIGTFTDGTRADFSFRATWTSGDPAIVQVSNNDIPTTVVVDGAFVDIASAPYRPGTLVPKGDPGAETIITASFVGITASLKVSIAQPAFLIAPLKSDVNLAAPSTSHVGVGTSQAFAFFAEQGGRVVLGSTLNALGPLNPILWRFQGATIDQFEGADPNDPDDFDKYALPSVADQKTVIGALSGIVRGRAADTERQVQAVTSLCRDESTDAAFMPTAPVRVAEFASSNPIELEHEADFNGAGSTTGDLISGTSELLKVTANLVTNDDPPVAVTQDISTQVDFNITHATCTAGTTNCTCDTAGANCTKNLFLVGGAGNLLFTLVDNDGTDATVQACFTAFDATHTDDCEEVDANGDPVAPLTSNTLNVTAVPVDLTGAGAFITLSAANASERAFTYPGTQFDAYGTFTALDENFRFAGDSATGTQKITRLATWITRPQGSTTEFSDVAAVSNRSDGFLNQSGRVVYFKDVTGSTPLEIYLSSLATPFASVAAPPTPVPFTVCPSSSAC